MQISKLTLEFLILIGSTIAACVTIAFAYATFQYSLALQKLQIEFDRKVQKNIDHNTSRIDKLIKAFKDLIKELKEQNRITEDIVIEDANIEHTDWNF